MEQEVQDEAAPLPPSLHRIPAAGPGASTGPDPDPSAQVFLGARRSKKGAGGRKAGVPVGQGMRVLGVCAVENVCGLK